MSENSNVSNPSSQQSIASQVQTPSTQVNSSSTTNNTPINTQVTPQTLKDGSVIIWDGSTITPEKYLYYLCWLMVHYNSSDIYLTHGEAPAIRNFWEIYRLAWLPLLEDSTLEAMSDILMTNEDKALYNEHLSCDVWYSVFNRRYRVNISRQRDHKMIVARLLEEKVPTIEDRCLPEIFKSLTQKTNWIIFVAWPTWSWKSTTLAAMIEEINTTRSSHIITIEDPIEYVFEPKKAIFDQKQLWKDVTSFASAMKYALRQRPDVILFGEARDPESLRNAIALAETGHLVLTTIHSRSAEQTIQKIISMFPADEQPLIRHQLSENMTAIIVQKLLKKSDWTGMIPAHEILLNNTAVSNTIREDKLNQLKNVIYTYRTAWMQMLEDNLASLVMNRTISPETAISNANDSDTLIRALASQWLEL